MPPHRIAPIVAGIVLIAAAALKYHADPIEGYGLLIHQALVLAESTLGILLLFGIGGKRLTQLAAMVFLIFFVFATIKFLRGDHSCGCFGNLIVPPWITALLDVALAAALAITSRKEKSEAPRAVNASTLVTHRSSLIACILILVTTTIAFWPARSAPSDTVDLKSLGIVSGNLIVLEPEKWVGKPVPFASLIEGGSIFTQGDWVILIVHDGCSTCEEAIPRYRAIETWGKNGFPKIAIIEVPPSTESQDYSWAQMSGSLPDKWEWFATTPMRLTIRGGQVSSVAQGELAVDAKSAVP